MSKWQNEPPWRPFTPSMQAKGQRTEGRYKIEGKAMRIEMRIVSSPFERLTEFIRKLLNRA